MENRKKLEIYRKETRDPI